MDQHFYNGFIKRAQDYGLSAVEADRLIKAADEKVRSTYADPRLDPRLMPHPNPNKPNVLVSKPGENMLATTWSPRTNQPRIIPQRRNPQDPRSVYPDLALPDSNPYQLHPNKPNVLIPKPGSNVRPTTFSTRGSMDGSVDGIMPGYSRIGEEQTKVAPDRDAMRKYRDLQLWIAKDKHERLDYWNKMTSGLEN